MDGYYLLSAFGAELPPGSVVIPAESFERVAAATHIVEEAKAQAQAIMAQSKDAFEREKERGYQDGLKQARLEAAQRLMEENRRLGIGLENVENELSRVVVACVRKLIDGFDDLEKGEAIVRAALKQMRQEKRAELRVPSALFTHFRATVSSITSEYPEVEVVDVIEDATLVGSHVILETAIGRVDGDLSQRLDDLEAIILRAHADSAGAGRAND